MVETYAQEMQVALERAARSIRSIARMNPRSTSYCFATDLPTAGALAGLSDDDLALLIERGLLQISLNPRALSFLPKR